MLDKLQNPPLNAELNAKLLEAKTPNYQAITPNAKDKIKRENKKLCEILDSKIARFFSFSVESFYFLLQNLSRHHKIALALSGHNLLYQAYLLLENKENIIPLIPDSNFGFITKDMIDYASNCGATCFIVPYLNEDILTKNSLELPKDALKIIDVSYAFALNLELDCALKNADLLLLNGENLGILRPYGILASKRDDFFSFPNISLEVENLYLIFKEAILARKKDSVYDLAQNFYNALHKHLQDDCYYFYKTPKNTLALGLKGIKARNLIQSLIFDKIFLINGQECLFGFAQPSFVLRLMGYSDAQSRELLSLSFLDISPSLIPQIAQKVAQKYLQIRNLD